MDVAVVGAGWAGLTAARSMHEAGLRVAVVEKSRGPGGRSATRREDGIAFDHGAQYFTARDPDFARQVAAWQGHGWVAPWNPRIRVVGRETPSSRNRTVTRWVAVPGMNRVCRELAAGLDCRYHWQVSSLDFDGHWRITNIDGEILAARGLVITAPPAQARDLLGENVPPGAGLETDLRPCLACVLEFREPPAADFDAAFVNDDGPLAWVARNDSKPGRAGAAWVLHATPEWSGQFLECSREEIGRRLTSAFRSLMDGDPPAPARRWVHRWRYALAVDPLEAGCLHFTDRHLAIAGDWCAGNRIEGAWLSGRAAGRRMVDPLAA